MLCLQGFLDQARLLGQESLNEALAMEHALSLRYVLTWAVCPIALMTRDLTAAGFHVAMLVALLSRHSGMFWRNVGKCLEGMLLIRRGAFADGSALLGEALDLFARIGFASMRHDTEYVGALTEGVAGMGQAAAALRTIEEALARCERDGVLWSMPELRRIKAELLLQLGEIPAAEACFGVALDEARFQGAVLWELRVARSLAGLRRRQQRHEEGLCVLAAVYDRFEEGFEAADLRAAKELLDLLRVG